MIIIPISTSALNVYFPALSEIKRLKSGGQKAVYSAQHNVHGTVVLKLIPVVEQDQRILREIEIVRNNQFSNVPRIYESSTIESEVGKLLYIIEQQVSGEDVRMLIDTYGKIPLRTVIKFMDAMLVTVVELEKKNIVHRDIKPDNVLYDINECFWLIDFGIARDINNVSLTATNDKFAPHTANYAPPEQIHNMKRLVNSRTDLFSIGVTAYEMLSGKNPFVVGVNNAFSSPMNTLTDMEIPLEIPEDIRHALSGFIRTLMQRNPAFRPPSAADALQWFKEVLKTLNLEII